MSLSLSLYLSPITSLSLSSTIFLTRSPPSPVSLSVSHQDTYTHTQTQTCSALLFAVSAAMNQMYILAFQHDNDNLGQLVQVSVRTLHADGRGFLNMNMQPMWDH